MKKKFLLVGLCLTMAATMALAACGNPNKGKTIALSSPNDVYGMGKRNFSINGLQEK